MKILKVNEYHEQLLNEFHISRQIRGFNRGKGDWAASMAREFISFIEALGCECILNCSFDLYKQFFAQVRIRKKVRGTGTISQSHFTHMRYSVNSLFQYLADRRLLESPPAMRQLFGFTKPQPKQIVGIRDIKALFEAAENPEESSLLALAFGCGLRRSELVRLQLSDYRSDGPTIIVRSGKYHKTRVVPIAESMHVHLRRYIESHNKSAKMNSARTWFVTPEGSPVCGDYLYRMLQRIVVRSGVDLDINLHILRNSVAVHMMNRGADIEFVQRFLGHEGIDTTMLYARKRRTRVSLKRKLNYADNRNHIGV